MADETPKTAAAPTLEDDVRNITALTAELAALRAEDGRLEFEYNEIAGGLHGDEADDDPDIVRIEQILARRDEIAAAVPALDERVRAANAALMAQMPQATQATGRGGRPLKTIKTAEGAEAFAAAHAGEIRARYTEATVEVLRTDDNGNPRLTFMDKLEDALEGWQTFVSVGLGGLGKSTRALQMAMLPYFDEDVQACIRSHWDAWDKHRWRDKSNKMRGVKLIEGGPQAVRDAAQEWRDLHPGKAKGEAKRKAPLQLFTASFKLDRDLYPDWDDAGLAALEAARLATVRPLGEWMVGKLVDAGMDIGEFYIILHNRDVYTVDDYLADGGSSKFVPGMPKYWHAHVVGRAVDKKSGLSLSAIARALGVPSNMIEKPKSGGHAYENMLAYLIHIKYEDKTQYNPSEVETIVGDIDYTDIYEARKEAWVKGRATMARKKYRERVDWLQQECADGRIRMSDIMQMVPDENGELTKPCELFKIYSVSKSAAAEIDAICASYTRLWMKATADAIGRDFERVNAIFYGPSRCGKTQLALTIRDGLLENFPGGGRRKWHFQRLANRNPLDDFDGSEIVMVNEMRSWTFPDYQSFLTFTDNTDCDPFGLRYKNKGAGAQRVTLFTTPTPPVNLFYFMPKGGKGQARFDSLNQAIARTNYAVEVLNPRENGRYCYRLYRPEECAPYTVEIVTGQGQYGLDEIDEVTLTWRFTPFDGLLSVDAVLDLIVRDIDAKCNGGRLTASGEIFRVVREFQKAFRDRIAKAVSEGRLPAPEPLPSLPASALSTATVAGGDGDGED